MIHDQIHENLDSFRMSLLQQPLHVRNGSILGVDVLVVGDVISVVFVGRDENGRNPNDINAESLELVQLVDDAVDVSVTVVVGVFERLGIDLVDDGLLPEGLISLNHL